MEDNTSYVISAFLCTLKLDNYFNKTMTVLEKNDSDLKQLFKKSSYFPNKIFLFKIDFL